MTRTLRLLLIVACLASVSNNFDAPPAAHAQAKTTYVCPMHAEVTSSSPDSTCPKCNMRLVAQKRVETKTPNARPPQASKPAAAALTTAERVRAMETLAPTYEYTCIMHPEVRRAEEGSCAKCGMPLTTVKPSVTGAYRLDVVPSPRQPRAGERVRLSFVVSHPQTGERVRNYVLNHEKLFHLFIISGDMSEYQHIHPELDADGTFHVETVLPRAGLYKLHSDFFPVGGTIQVLHRELVTAGYKAQRQRAPIAARLVPDTVFTKTIDGMRINLGWSGELVPGAFVRLKYTLADAQTGEPVKDLEPYLGAWGHTLILDADQSDYLHSHPTETLPDVANRAALRGGPEVEFGAMFPEAGNYRIWTQFQRGGRVSTVSFTIRVRTAATTEDD